MSIMEIMVLKEHVWGVTPTLGVEPEKSIKWYIKRIHSCDDWTKVFRA